MSIGTWNPDEQLVEISVAKVKCKICLNNLQILPGGVQNMNNRKFSNLARMYCRFSGTISKKILKFNVQFQKIPTPCKVNGNSEG